MYPILQSDISNSIKIEYAIGIIPTQYVNNGGYYTYTLPYAYGSKYSITFNEIDYAHLPTVKNKTKTSFDFSTGNNTFPMDFITVGY